MNRLVQFLLLLTATFSSSAHVPAVAVSVNGLTTWKLHGPDLNGAYGAFEAIAPPPDLFCPVLPDARGNLHAVYDQRHGDLVWFKSCVTGYGAVPGHRPPPLGYGSDAASGSAWRGVWSDLTGYYLRGYRYYDPESHRWLSADPLGHAADPSLMTFCAGDPINFDDPLGLDKNPAFNAASSGLANPWSDYTSALVGLYRAEAQIYSADQRQAAVRAHYDDVVSFIGDRARWNDRVDEWVNSISGAHVTDHSLDERREISSILDWVPGVNVVKSAFQASLGMDLITGERVNPYGQLAMTALNAAPFGALGSIGGRVSGQANIFLKSGSWLNAWADNGGQTILTRAPYGGRFGPALDRIGIYRYNAQIVNRDSLGTWAHIDTQAHERTHAFMGNYFAGIVDMGNARIGAFPIGAPIKYAHEVGAWSVGRIAAGRIHALPFAPIDAFTSLSVPERWVAGAAVGAGSFGAGAWYMNQNR